MSTTRPASPISGSPPSPKHSPQKRKKPSLSSPIYSPPISPSLNSPFRRCSIQNSPDPSDRKTKKITHAFKQRKLSTSSSSSFSSPRSPTSFSSPRSPSSFSRFSILRSPSPMPADMLVFAQIAFSFLPNTNSLKKLANFFEQKSSFSPEAQAFIEECVKTIYDKWGSPKANQQLCEDLQNAYNLFSCKNRKEIELIETILQQIYPLLLAGEYTLLFFLFSLSSPSSTQKVKEFNEFLDRSEGEAYAALFSPSLPACIRKCLGSSLQEKEKRDLTTVFFASLPERLNRIISTVQELDEALTQAKMFFTFPGHERLCPFHQKEFLQFFLDQLEHAHSTAQGPLKKVLHHHLSRFQGCFVLREDHLFQPEVSGGRVTGLHYFSKEVWEDLRTSPSKEIVFGVDETSMHVRMLYPLLELPNHVQIGFFSACFYAPHQSINKSQCKFTMFFPQEMSQEDIFQAIEKALDNPFNDYQNAWEQGGLQTSLFSVVAVRLENETISLPLFMYLHRENTHPSSVITISSAFPVIADFRKFTHAPERSLNNSTLIYVQKGTGLKSSPLKNKPELAYSNSPLKLKLEQGMEEAKNSRQEEKGKKARSFREHLAQTSSLQGTYLPGPPNSPHLVLKAEIDTNWFNRIVEYIKARKQNLALLASEEDLEDALQHLRGLNFFAIYLLDELEREGKENKHRERKTRLDFDSTL